MIEILSITKNPLEDIGLKAGICYDTTNPKMFERIAKRCLEEGHWKTAEFPDIQILISGHSAKVAREMYTHNFCTKLQASTRYIDYTKLFDYIIPYSVSKDKEALDTWQKHMIEVSKTMSKLKDLGIPPEDFSNVLPLAYETKWVMKIGLRELIQIFNVRACTCAYWEMRNLVADIKTAILLCGDEQWVWLAENYLVPKCVRYGYCEEEKRWDKCKRYPKKSQVLEWAKERMGSENWRE